jgi:fructosamine-3-kinase
MTPATPHPLQEASTRSAIKRAVTRHLGRAWRSVTFTDLHDLSSHPAALLGDGEHTIFAKQCSGRNALHQLQCELAGLKLLAVAGVRTPTTLDVLELEDCAVIVMNAVQSVPRGPAEWRAIGRVLAQLHHNRAEEFGLSSRNYFGPCYQDNRPCTSWSTFFAERRLWPRLIAAIDAGQLSRHTVRRVERIIARLPELCGPEPVPALLHGDAQNNNFISTAEGAVVIDPAVFYGHPEYDLALIDYFEAVPEDVFDGYRELRLDRCWLCRAARTMAHSRVSGCAATRRLGLGAYAGCGARAI